MALLSPHFELQEVTKHDMSLASICWGFTLGFGFLTTWEAIRQTIRARTPWKSIYVWMIWGEIFVCLAFSIICWMYLDGTIGPSFWFYFFILTLWALQVQLLLQIIINRITVIAADKHRAGLIKWGVAALITAVNISVYCIWIPARLQISHRYIHINEIWDRCEKVIYLVVDAILNWYFINTVRQRLVKQGSGKYNRLVKFNVRIIFLSLTMDCLIIGTMSLKNGFVYMQFHPLAYTVKLMIEMSMADLIRTIAREKNEFKSANQSYQLSANGKSRGRRDGNLSHMVGVEVGGGAGLTSVSGVVVQKEVIVESRSMDQASEASTSKDNVHHQEQEDESPLRTETWEVNSP
ncbi:unnamed protein product [Tuber melanosporum]|uniref:(Perigord truffle) hypothetical protein n=1 Tax=Tuber melanosporum (strain Mel28) TaxID=656061 RepID=D5GPL2_TUBMM|nr:uncharacterized protein GSTUM_00011901001 [Tuber melanosporum]CAZ86455.1 unnamed protein product [Tuber melanosporum]